MSERAGGGYAGRIALLALLPCLVAISGQPGVPAPPPPGTATLGSVAGTGRLGALPVPRRQAFDASAALSIERWLPTALPALGVTLGFPDLVTRAEPRWQPMIVWRERAGAHGGEPEPVAHIGCMGVSATALADRADPFLPEVIELAFEHGVSASLLKAVITEESCFDADAHSRSGAQGLMQLMPETAAWLGVDEPLDVTQNLTAGTRYLASLLDEFDDVTLALAAYNAGPGTVRRHGGVPPYAETQRYVKRVRSFQRRYAVAARLASGGLDR